ncbi:MinD/ParA family protein [Sutcliffiella rhizosphaerae]|uniref:Flagellum site-determining protein YlxH n=1 Tax=Sutcliffiella rhizosphaerae TaxID=2880967 RepID=A0ABM8YIR5_9BACI|nr:MinD/ParA family protein [Sutcliffiella rhizosphaerae]CAG9619693.1 Flagellum site-determining protein YlxH [Sutcliffiella rhizosphaerae]
MNDQAQVLRERVLNSKNNMLTADKKEAKVIGVISGKGGVGKSNFSLNFSLSLQKQGFRVLLFDMDIGMANVDVLMGTTQRYSIIDIFERNMTLTEIIQSGPENLSYIAGGSGLTNVFQMNDNKREQFLTQLQDLSYSYDFILFDMGAGITDESRKLLLSCHELFLVTTCEPTSLTDAYSAVKFIYAHANVKPIPIQLVINRVISKKIAQVTAERLNNVTKKFLNRELLHLGSLPDDKYVSLAVMEQVPFVLKYPSSAAALAIKSLTLRYLQENNKYQKKKVDTFIMKLRSFFA